MVWWRRRGDQFELAQAADRIRARAAALAEKLSPHVPLTEETKTLDIGSGPEPEICDLPGRRYALDPLAHFFRRQFGHSLSDQVAWVEGIGEDLPWRDGAFDVVLCLNVLDHTWEPRMAVRELLRVTRAGGHCLLGVNCLGNVAYWAHRLVGRWTDPEHPHSFTEQHLRALLLGEAVGGHVFRLVDRWAARARRGGLKGTPLLKRIARALCPSRNRVEYLMEKVPR